MWSSFKVTDEVRDITQRKNPCLVYTRSILILSTKNKQTKNLTTPCIPTYIRRCMLNTYNGCQFHMKWIPQKHRIMNWDILMFGHVATSSQNETTRISRLENRIKSLSTIVIIQFYTFSNVIQYHNYIFVFLFIYTCFPNCLKCLRNWVLFLSSVQVLNCWVAIILLCLKNLQ